MDEKRLILAAVLSLGVIAVWQVVFPPPVAVEEQGVEPAAAPSPAEPRTAAAAVAGAGPPSEVTAGGTPEVPTWGTASEEQTVEIQGEGFRARISNRGGQIVSYQLTEHVGLGGGALEMVRQRDRGPFPYGVVDAEGEPLLADALFHVERSAGRVTLRWSEGPRWAEKEFRFGARGELEVRVRAALAGEAWHVWLGPGVRNPSDAEDGQQYQVKEALWRSAGEVERRLARKVTELEDVPLSGLEWVALDDTYFISAVFLDPSVARVGLVPTIRRDEPAGTRYEPLADLSKLKGQEKKAPREIALVFEPAAGEIVLPGFWGGKERKRLDELGRGLPEAIDWGFFGILSRPLHSGLLWLHSRVVPNYGWAIVIMTILIKIVLLPLTHVSHVSMQKMQEVNPKAQAIRAKYRGKLRDKDGRFNVENQRRMNEEMQAVYSEAGVNPMSGCLPMLAQIPIFFAYFRLLPLAIELRMAPWLGWIQDLSAADPYFLLPVIMGVTQVIQMKLTPQASDPIQRRIMQLFPIVFTVFSLGFPSGLVLYWLTNNIFTIGQIWTYNRIKAAKAAK